MKNLTPAIFTLVVLMGLTSACGPVVHVEALPIGLLNESYSYTFRFDDGDDWFSWDEDLVLDVVRGDLPDGVGLTADGELIGTPTEVGNFEFKVALYSIDEGFWDDDDVDSDSEWFTLFVTEPSTNDACPSPNNESVAETYICLGTVTAATMATGEAFTLDVEYFINYASAPDYDIDAITFTVTYDAASFAPDEDALNSEILREAATRHGATVSIDTNTAGTLTLTITATEQNFHAAGRLADLPFHAIADLAASTYDFAVAFSLDSGDDAELPSNINVNGSVTVEEDIPAEE